MFFKGSTVHLHVYISASSRNFRHGGKLIQVGHYLIKKGVVISHFGTHPMFFLEQKYASVYHLCEALCQKDIYTCTSIR